MSQRAFSPEIEDVIGKLVNSFCRRNNLSRHVNNTKEDLLAEARIAAWMAITKYDASKQCKLRSYVARCVSNRLKDLNKIAYTKKRASYELFESFEDLDSFMLMGQPPNEFEWHLDAAKTLSKSDYEIFLMILAGYRIGEIINYVASKNNTGRHRAKGMVKKCFFRIWQKFHSPEMNHTLIQKKKLRLSAVAMA